MLRLPVQKLSIDQESYDAELRHQSCTMKQYRITCSCSTELILPQCMQQPVSALQ